MLDNSQLDALKERDPELLERIVSQHARPLFRASRGFGFSPEEAEDLVQDVFLTFLETLERFEGRSAIRTWLFGILHYKVRERRRSHSRERKNDPIDEVVESRFDEKGSWSRPPLELHRLIQNQELGNAIEECMEDLPESQRTVFVLRDIEDLKTDEICKILEVIRTNLFVLTSRARARLRECLEKKEVSKPE